jgi:hypothetical protein
MAIVIIHGAQGAGKSRHAAAFLSHYRCKRLVDDWNGKTRLQDGDLAITNLPPPYAGTRAAIIVSAEQAKGAALGGRS